MRLDRHSDRHLPAELVFVPRKGNKNYPEPVPFKYGENWFEGRGIAGRVISRYSEKSPQRSESLGEVLASGLQFGSESLLRLSAALCPATPDVLLIFVMVQDKLQYAKEVLREEAEALNALVERLDENFSYAVDLILEMRSKGHVVISGMGKAGFIGMKISATLASIGVPSFHLNPAEAVHGDLGRYTKHDLSIMLSYSGETDEVLRIVPLIKQVGCPIISMTGNENSTLARYSDVVLKLGPIVEAGPLGLAPTTSTTAMLALGDALAMSVLRLNGLSKEEFAFFHSGGSLGRSLMPVCRIMRTGDQHCIVDETVTAREVLHRITETKGRPGAATIVNAQGKLIGIFTDGDFRRCLMQRNDFLDLPISQVVSRNPKTIKPDAIAAEALRLLNTYHIDQVIVVDDSGRPVGLVDIQDLVEVRLLPLKGQQTPAGK